MANSSPRPASPMNLACSETVAALCGLTLAALAGAVAPARACAGEPVALKPYEAEYRTAVRGLKLSTHRQLKCEGGGRYTLTADGRNLVANLQEVSVFRVEGERVQPKSYVYQLTAPLLKRRREVHFAPGSESIRSLYKNEWYELPYTESTLDRMSQQEQLRLFLLNEPHPDENFSFRVADGKRIKEYDFIFRGEEVIDTPLGRVNTLRFERTHDSPERKSETWVAPAWDYLMVRAIHIEDDQPVEALITAASIDGQPVVPDA